MNCPKHYFTWSPTNSGVHEKVYICIRCGLRMISDSPNFLESHNEQEKTG